MARQEFEAALNHIEKILSFMEDEKPALGHPLDGTMEPFRIYLTCYQVLKANQDPRAPTILAEAYNQLQKRAANISDDELRNCFLNNVAANREMVIEYEDSGLGEMQI
jgi:exonuclease VII small subunit